MHFQELEKKHSSFLPPPFLRLFSSISPQSYRSCVKREGERKKRNSIREREEKTVTFFPLPPGKNLNQPISKRCGAGEREGGGDQTQKKVGREGRISFAPTNKSTLFSSLPFPYPLGAKKKKKKSGNIWESKVCVCVFWLCPRRLSKHTHGVKETRERGDLSICAWVNSLHWREKELSFRIYQNTVKSWNLSRRDLRQVST